ncbi:MAG TPA: hypothetical protein VN805_12725 [Caulobacteraceae bacterium]|nr:hypothetical protein [Caulobacteraceae bacterium]
MTSNVQSDARFYRLVLGGWWFAVSLLGVLRLTQGDRFQAIVLLISGTLTLLLGVALSIDRAREGGEQTQEVEALRLQKATTLFSVIAISTVLGCAILNGALWWAAVECAALVWIVPAVIWPLARARMAKHAARPA